MSDEDELFGSLLQLFYDYISFNPTLISDPSFEEDMIDDTIDLLLLENDCIQEEEIYDLIDPVLSFFYDNLYTIRSYSSSCILCSLSSFQKDIIAEQISHLSSIPQPQQRTEEWYQFRNNLITASNAYKIFESMAQQNSLIYEKCNSINNMVIKETTFVNTETTLHWGQKYEPLSVMFYEQIYETQVGEFGCIRHRTYPFIGASPDGINICSTNDRYGRMLEIKNIVNREITGIPKKEYWIQMQLQMETCDLDECDFFETRFVEYENETMFLKDSDYSLFTSVQGERKGIILYFSNQVTGVPLYIYTPLSIQTYLEYETWSNQMIEETLKNTDLIWVRQIYWRLDEWSCVLVRRNRKWFTDVVPIMRDFWKMIEEERVTGWEHRAPKKRSTSSSSL